MILASLNFVSLFFLSFSNPYEEILNSFLDQGENIKFHDSFLAQKNYITSELGFIRKNIASKSSGIYFDSKTGCIQVSFKERPDLISVTIPIQDLLDSSVHYPDKLGLENDLLDRGFQEEDLPIIKGFLQKNKMVFQLVRAKKLEKIRETEVGSFLDQSRQFWKELDRGKIKRFFLLDTKLSLDLADQWVVNFVDQLSPHSARVLISLAYEQIGTIWKFYYREDNPIPDIEEMIDGVKRDGFDIKNY